MKKFLQRLLMGLGIGIVLLAGIILWRTFTFSSRQPQVEKGEPVRINTDTAVTHLAEALRYPTVSHHNKPFDTVDFNNFRTYLQNTYPLTDSLLEKNIINRLSLVYKWPGKHPDRKPVILLAHQDVVPVDSVSRENWKVDPLGGIIRDSIIWGRGALDFKSGLIGMMEATEKLLAEGHVPGRTVYFVFAHDEEVGGKNGAKAVVQHLKNQGVEASYLLDEGLMVTRGLVPGISKDVALIGIAEKGYVSVELSVNMAGGHSSMPPERTSIGVLSEAIKRLRKHRFKARISAPVKEFIRHIGPEMPFTQKMAFANPYLFEGVIKSTYKKSVSGNALVRTTTAPTIFKAGNQENVVPEKARAVVNCRILPGETSDDVLQHFRKVIKDTNITLKKGAVVSEPPEVSRTDTRGYQHITRSIHKTFPETYSAPSLMLATTDSRHYKEITEDIYRFAPLIVTARDLERIHGSNERLPVKHLKKCVEFYYRFLKGVE